MSKTKSEILADINLIKNETGARANTAARIGGTMEEIFTAIPDVPTDYIKTVNGKEPDNTGNVEITVAKPEGAVMSVNGEEPDAQGNVELEIPSTDDFATKEYVDGKMGKETIIDNLDNLLPNEYYTIASAIDLGGKTINIPKGVRLIFSGGSLDNGRLVFVDDPSKVISGAYKTFGLGLSVYTKAGGTVEFDWWQFYDWSSDETYGGTYAKFCKEVFEMLDTQYPTERGTVATGYAAGEIKACQDNSYAPGKTNEIPITNNTIIENICKRLPGEGSASGDEQDCGRQLTIKFGRKIYPFQNSISVLADTQFCRILGEGKNRTCLVFNDKGIIQSNAFQLELRSLCITSVRACLSYESATLKSPGFGTYDDDFFISLRGNCVDCPKFLDDGPKNLAVMNKNTFNDIIVVPGPNCCGFSNVTSTTAVFDKISDYFRTYRDFYTISDKAQSADGSPSSTDDRPLRPYKAMFGFYNLVENNASDTQKCFTIGTISHISWNYGRKCSYLIYSEDANVAFNQLNISFSHIENNQREKAYFIYVDNNCPATSNPNIDNGTKTVIRLIGNRFNGVYDSFEYPLITAPNLVITGDLENNDTVGETSYHYIKCSKTIDNHTGASFKNVYNATSEDTCQIVTPHSISNYKKYMPHNGKTVYLGVGQGSSPYYKVGEDFEREYFNININTLKSEIDNYLVSKPDANTFTYYGLNVPTTTGSEKFNICGDIKLTASDYTESYVKHFMTGAFKGAIVAGGSINFNNFKEVSIKNDTKMALNIASASNFNGIKTKFVVLPNTTMNLTINGVQPMYPAGCTDQIVKNIIFLFNNYKGKQVYYADSDDWQYDMPFTFSVNPSNYDDAGIIVKNNDRQSNKRYWTKDLSGEGQYSTNGGLDGYYTYNGYIYWCVKSGDTASSRPSSIPEGINKIFTDGDAEFVCLGKNGKISLTNATWEKEKLTTKLSAVSLPWNIATGATLFDLTAKKMNVYDGSNWVEL